MFPISNSVVYAASRSNFNKNTQQRREGLEKARRESLKRIRTELKQISSREKEFGKQLLDVIVPVRVHFNDEIFKKNNLFTLEFLNKDESEELNIIVEENDAYLDD